jgi:hypothetical protein
MMPKRGGFVEVVMVVFKNGGSDGCFDYGLDDFTRCFSMGL